MGNENQYSENVVMKMLLESWDFLAEVNQKPRGQIWTPLFVLVQSKRYAWHGSEARSLVSAVI